MAKMSRKEEKRRKRHRRVRKAVRGVPGKERLCIFKSLKHIYAQVIDDTTGRIVSSASSLSPEFKKEMSYGGNVKAAELTGKVVAEKCRKSGIEKVVFDRAGYPYCGRVEALAKAAREGGLVF
jgi:large subunit ribosomal protein L18